MILPSGWRIAALPPSNPPKSVVTIPPVPKVGSNDPSAASAGVTPANITASARNELINLWKDLCVILFSFLRWVKQNTLTTLRLSNCQSQRGNCQKLPVLGEGKGD